MAKIDGTKILLKIGASTFSGLLDNSFTQTVDTIETTTKDSSGHKEYIGGEDDGDFSASGLYDPSGTYSLQEIFAAQLAKTAVTVLQGGATAGDETISASCIITSVGWTNGKNSASGISAAFKKTGIATFGTVGS